MRTSRATSGPCRGNCRNPSAGRSTSRCPPPRGCEPLRIQRGGVVPGENRSESAVFLRLFMKFLEPYQRLKSFQFVKMHLLRSQRFLRNLPYMDRDCAGAGSRACRPICAVPTARVHQAMNARSSDRLTIALAPLDPTVGDVTGCLQKARQARAAAARAGADCVMLSELVIGVSPPA